jgi:acyl-CoA synthetase (AMP-forming)/AMP-acid ligase II
MVEALRSRADRQPEHPAFVFLRNGELEVDRLTFARLDTRARGLASALGEIARPGDRLMLVYTPGLAFVEALFACSYAGVIAVPVSPPRRAAFVDKLLAITADCGIRGFLTDTACLDTVRSAGAMTPTSSPDDSGTPGPLRILATDAIAKAELEAAADTFRAARIEGETTALLQYTSGSTGQPKGVRVSHANLVHNAEMINVGFGHGPDTTMVGWLPLFHDMGLVGSVMQPIYNGFLSVLMPPVAFIQRPSRWLRAISKYRATTSGGPNFGYDLCVARHRPEHLEGVDLSSWRVAFNGAEPVRSQTLERFTRAFAPYGFQARMHHPCYGMAEATLVVSGGAVDESHRVLRLDAGELASGRAVDATSTPMARATVREVVCCGRTIGEQIIRVVDPVTRDLCPDSHVGEIWVRGPNVSDGYWNKPDENPAAFGAHLRDGAEGPFLRTGDAGFLRDGRLYVTGRLKEIVILKGRNLFPHDLELAVQKSHSAFCLGGGAAFSIDTDDEERLVVVHEVVRGTDAAARHASLLGAAREALAVEFDAHLSDLVLIGQGTLPKTSSGKVQRLRCRALYLAGEFGGARRRDPEPREERPQ